jgi:glycosyltransferase involved in cell wall biosynthesis
MSRLAVLITYHNEGALLTRCLTSLMSQTWPVDQVLLYDDASTLAPEHHVPPGCALVIIRGERNIGPARARNVLLRSTTADLVHFHDADDEFVPSWCEKVKSAFAADVDSVLTEISRRSHTGQQVECTLGLKSVADGGDLVPFSIRGALLPSAGTYRKTVVDAVGGYRESLWQSEDWDFHVRLLASGVRARLILEPLVVAHRRSDSRSERREEVWSSAIDAIRLLSTEIPQEYRPDLAEAASRAGSELHRAGAVRKARVAFALARQLGGARRKTGRPLYRSAALMAGLEGAERLGRLYRWAIPLSVRVFLAERGW